MQLLPPQPNHYLPLMVLFLFSVSGSSLAHMSLLALQLLLRPNTTQNYCNAAMSMVVAPLVLLLNL